MLLNYQLYVLLLLFAAALAGYVCAQRSRWRHGYAVAVLLAYFGSVPAISNRVTLYLEHQYPPPVLLNLKRSEQDVILVLTGGWFHRQGTSYEVRIGEDGWERLRAALVLHDQIGGRILFSGAPSPDGTNSIARAMKEAAVREGVPDSDILIEEQSTNTYENILFATRLIGEPQGQVWLVTTAFRMPRAMAVARHLGMNMIPFPCDFHGERNMTWRAWLPASHAPLALENGLHEIVGWMVYRWRGWL